MAFRVLATARSFCTTAGLHQDILRQNGCDLILKAGDHPLSADELRPLMVDVDGAILGLDVCDETVIAAANRLRVISRYGIGVDNVDLDAASRRGIAVTNTPNTNHIAVAELTIGLVFALARDLPNTAASTRAGVWKRTTGWELTGKTLGLVGYGAIGREVARRAFGLGMRVLAYDPYWRGAWDQAEPAELPALLAASKIVSLHCPLTPQTANLINRETLAQMQDGAVLINTARGGLVDEAALYEALRAGKLSGAAMDAFAHEPPQGSPLLELANFIATPHMGGTTIEAIERMGLLAAQNTLAILRGEPCPYVVNRAALEGAERTSS